MEEQKEVQQQQQQNDTQSQAQAQQKPAKARYVYKEPRRKQKSKWVICITDFYWILFFSKGIHDSLWFKHITGFFEKDLRVDDNILKCLIPRKVEGFEKFGAEGSGYAFTFKNVENGNTFDAGYFYFDSIQNM